jgi:hypothetical protein
MVGLFFRNERFQRRFVRVREWGRIFGDWVPAMRSGPARLFASANRGLPNTPKNRQLRAHGSPRAIRSMNVSARNLPSSRGETTEDEGFSARSATPARCAAPRAGVEPAESVKESRLAAARIPRRIVAKEWHSRHARKSDDGRGSCSRALLPVAIAYRAAAFRRSCCPRSNRIKIRRRGGENENKVLRRASRIRARDQHG